MARHLQITMTTALVVLAGSFSAGARSSMPADDRWNPQHIDVLPSEVRNAIVPYARICGGPLAAGHSFVRYFQNGTVKLIGAFILKTSAVVIGLRFARRLVASIRSTFREVAVHIAF